MKYAVERGIPTPPKYRPRGPNRLYPYDKMEIGDSFAFPEEKLSSVRKTASRYQNKIGGQYVVSGKHLRCWRID